MYGSHEGQSPSEPSRPLCFKNYFADVQHLILVNKITVHIHSSSWLCEDSKQENCCTKPFTECRCLSFPLQQYLKSKCNYFVLEVWAPEVGQDLLYVWSSEVSLGMFLNDFQNAEIGNTASNFCPSWMKKVVSHHLELQVRTYYYCFSFKVLTNYTEEWNWGYDCSWREGSGIWSLWW